MGAGWSAKTRIVTLVFFLIASIPGCTREVILPDSFPPGPILFSNARIVYDADTPLTSGQSLLIDDGVIVAVGEDVATPEGATVVDLKGRTVLPGLIDMHGHFYANVGSRMQTQGEAYPRLYLAGGVTTVFSPGELEPADIEALQVRIAAGEELGPRILSAGPYFDGDPSDILWIEGSESTDAVVEKYDAWKDRIDAVKAYTSIGEEQLAELILRASSDGKFVTGHLESVSGTRAIEMGIDGIEHGLLSFSEFGAPEGDVWEHLCRLSTVDVSSDSVQSVIRSLADRKVYVTPTLVTLQSGLPEFEAVTPNWRDFTSPGAARVAEAWAANGFPSQREAECMRTLIDKQVQFTQALHEAGGVIVAGTDPVLPNLIPGYGLHRELENLVAAGLTPLEAIEAATIVSAEILGVAGVTGSIEPGKEADLYVVDGDPTKDIGVIGLGVLVVRGGRVHSPGELRESVRGLIGRSEDAPVRWDY